MRYEINWAVGGRRVVEAATAEEARLDAQELLPSGADWHDIDICEAGESFRVS